MVAQILCATIRSCYPLFMFSSQLARLQALCYRFSYNIIAKITMHLQCLLLNKNYHRCFPTLSLPASSVKMLKLGELLNIPSFTNKNEGSGNEYNRYWRHVVLLLCGCVLSLTPLNATSTLTTKNSKINFSYPGVLWF